MAIKIEGSKRKVKTNRNPLFHDEKYMGTEPVWNTEQALTFSSEEYDHHLRKSLHYYNYFYSVKELKKYLVEWLRGYSLTHKKFDSDNVNKYAKSSDDYTPMTACAIARAHHQGMPLHDKQLNYLISVINNALELSRNDIVEEKTTPTSVRKITIQDRLNEKTSEVLGELDGHFDDVTVGPTQFNAYNFLVTNTVPQGQLGKFEKIYENIKAELELAQSGKDEQLTEAYSHKTTADIKRILAFVDNLLGSVAQYRGVKQATKKARVKKAPVKEKIVAKLKYRKNDPTFKLVSINPVDIIGASTLWTYNTKTRKLGRYDVADATAGLSVKGNTIIGYNERTSIQKMMRRPEEQLKEFAKAGKVQLRRFLEDIRAVETKLKARLGTDIILLKVA